MSQLHLLGDGEEIARRRGLGPKERAIEAWPDLHIRGLFWVGDDSKAILDGLGAPLTAHLSIPAEAVAVYYGPRLCDLESLPAEESLRGRVLSAHGIAAAWITLDRFGERDAHSPESPLDPVFHLRRMGGGAGHLWRLFTSRQDAIAHLGERYGQDSEAVEWAQALGVEDWDALLGRYAPGP